MLKFKKFFSVILTGLAVVFLVACSSNAKEVKSGFQMFDESGYDSRLVYYHKGDVVTKQTTDNIVTYEYLGISTKEEAKALIEANSNGYDYKGVSYSIDYQDDRLVEKITVDYTKASLKEIAEPVLKMSADEAKNAKYISFKESIPVVKEAGYTEVKDMEFQELP